MRTKWSNEEINILKQNATNIHMDDLVLLLPHRTAKQINKKCSNLKIIRKHLRSNWNVNEINILKLYGSTKSAKEIKEFLPNHSEYGIGHKLKRLRILKSKEYLSDHGRKYLVTNRLPNFDELRYRKLDQNFSIDDLSNETYQILIGSMLGDGCVKKQNKNSKNYIFKEDHSVAQADYLVWKQRMMKEFDAVMPHTLDKKPDFSTSIHPIFSKLRQEIYNESGIYGKKAYIPLHYIEKLDELGLLIWYLDDGDLNKYKYPSISSTLFSSENLNNTIDILNNNLNLSLYLKISPTYHERKRICFGVKNKDRIMPIWWKLVQKYNIPMCMWYKLTKKELDNPALFDE